MPKQITGARRPSASTVAIVGSCSSARRVAAWPTIAGTGSRVAAPFAERAKSSAVLLVRVEGERMFIAPLSSTTSTPSFHCGGSRRATALIVRPQDTPMSAKGPSEAMNCAAACATLSSASASSSSVCSRTTTASLRPKRRCRRLSRWGLRAVLGTISMRTMPHSRASFKRRRACHRVRPSSLASSPIVMSR